MQARDIRLSVTGESICLKDHTERASAGPPMEVGYEAIANTTPVVPNSAFHPFGREPRLFDSFYVGCAEAFSKPGAEVSLCFKFAGPELGPLALVAGAGLVQVFGVGAGRPALSRPARQGAAAADPDRAAARPDRGAALAPHSHVAARLFEDRVLIAIAGQGTVYFAMLPFKEPLDPAAIEWKPLINENHRGVAIGQIAIVVESKKPVVLAQAEGSVLRWVDPAGVPPATPLAKRQLVPLQGADAALLIGPEEGGNRTIDLKGLGEAEPLTLKADSLPAFDHAAWAAPSATAGALPGFIFLAGYQNDSGKADLRVVRISTAAKVVKDIETLGGADLPGEAKVAPERWPIAFQPPPPGAPPPSPAAGAGDVPPTIILASATPARFVWHGNRYVKAKTASPIGLSDNLHRQFVSASGWIAVHRGDLGLLYRAAGGNGDWADEFVLAANAERLAVVEKLPDDIYAAPGPKPAGDGYEILRSQTPLRALLRLRPDLRELTRGSGAPAVFFFVDGDVAEGTLEVGEKVRLRDDVLYDQWHRENEKRTGLDEEVRQAQEGVTSRTGEKDAADRRVREAEKTFRNEEEAAARPRRQRPVRLRQRRMRRASFSWRRTLTVRPRRILAELRADREAAGRLPEATGARTAAEAERDRLKGEAKKEADAVAAAQRDLPAKTAAREKAQGDMVALEAAVEAARLEHAQATEDFSEGGGDPAKKKALDDAEKGLQDATAPRDKARGELATLEAEERALTAAAAKEATVSQAMIESAEARVAAAKEVEQARKAAAAKGVTEKMIEAAETGVSAAEKKEKAAQKKATEANEDKRLGAEAQSIAEGKRDAAKATLDAQVGDAREKARQVGLAQATLDAKKASRDEAARTARSLETYSAAVDKPEVVIRVFRAGAAQDRHQIWHLERSRDPQWRDKPSGFSSALPPGDKILPLPDFGQGGGAAHCGGGGDPGQGEVRGPDPGVRRRATASPGRSRAGPAG